MICNGSRLTMVAAALAAGLFALAPDADAQVRRNVTPRTSRPAPETPEPDTPAPGATAGDASATPETTPEMTPEGEDDAETEDEEGEEREVNLEMIDRMIETRGTTWLLEQDIVREKLGISDQQYARIQQADSLMDERRDQMRDQMRAQFEQMRRQGGPGGYPGGPGGFNPGMGGPDAFRSMFAQMRQSADQAVAQLLSPKQLKRLEEIKLQAGGPWAIADQEVMARLNLMPAQQQQIMDIKEAWEDQSSNERRRLFTERFRRAREEQRRGEGDQTGARSEGSQARSGDDDDDNDEDDNGRRRFEVDPETRAELEKLEEQEKAHEIKALQKIYGTILYSSQKREFAKLRGEPFPFEELELGRGWGGRGGDRGGRDRGGDDDRD